MKRIVGYFSNTVFIIGGALLIGMYGHRFFAELTRIDAYYNTSMILTGMGPEAEMITKVAKLFTSFCALFSGMVFLSTIAILFAPIAHRILHKFHLENESTE